MTTLFSGLLIVWTVEVCGFAVDLLVYLWQTR